MDHKIHKFISGNEFYKLLMSGTEALKKNRANQSVLLLDLGHQPGTPDYQLAVSTRLEDHNWLSSPAYVVSDGPHAVEIGWGAASAPGVAEG